MSVKPGGFTRSFILVFSCRLGMIALWFYALILLNMRLGKAGAGTFALCIMFIRSTSSFLGDSIDLAVVRRVPEYLKSNRPRALEILHASFWLRIAIAAAIAAAVLPMSSYLAREFLGAGQLSPLVLIAVAGLLGELLFRALLSYLQAEEAFARYAFIESALQVLRFVAVVLLILSGTLSPGTALVAYVAVSFIAFAMGLSALPREIVRISLSGREKLAEIFHDSKWIMMAFAVAAVSDRLEYFMLGKIRGPGEVGIYHAAFTLALFPDVICSALLTIFQPKTVRLYREGGFAELHRRFLGWSLPLCAAAIAGAFVLGGTVIGFIYRGMYAESVMTFKVLAAGKLFFLAAATLPMTLVALVAPERMLWINLLQMALTFGGGAVLIGRMGHLGAAILVTAVRVAVAVLLLAESARLLRERPPVHGENPEPAALSRAIDLRAAGNPSETRGTAQDEGGAGID